MSRGTLFGSLPSPYARLCRLVRLKCGLVQHIAFQEADPFARDFREKNPLGKVPVLILNQGPPLTETTLICRTLMAMGGPLRSDDPDAARREEADVAMLMGLLDLGVAHRFEFLRPESEQSAKWQQRRLDGMHAALPLVDDAAVRASQQPESYGALAIVSALDWLEFRMADFIDWRGACPRAADLVDQLKDDKVIASTGPRVG